MPRRKPIYLWDRESIITLIQLYKEHPCLYMITDTNFNNKIARNQAFRKITTDYNKKKQTKLTVTAITTKIKGLRAKFFAEVDKVKRLEVMGVQRDQVVKTTWWCFEHLSFLRNAKAKVISYLPSTSTSSENTSAHDDDPLDEDFDNTYEESKRMRVEDLSGSKHIGFSRFLIEELDKFEDEDIVDELKQVITSLIFSHKRKLRVKDK